MDRVDDHRVRIMRIPKEGVGHAARLDEPLGLPMIAGDDCRIVRLHVDEAGVHHMLTPAAAAPSTAARCWRTRARPACPRSAAACAPRAPPPRGFRLVEVPVTHVAANPLPLGELGRRTGDEDQIPGPAHRNQFVRREPSILAGGPGDGNPRHAHTLMRPLRVRRRSPTTVHLGRRRCGISTRATGPPATLPASTIQRKCRKLGGPSGLAPRAPARSVRPPREQPALVVRLRRRYVDRLVETMRRRQRQRLRRLAREIETQEHVEHRAHGTARDRRALHLRIHRQHPAVGIRTALTAAGITGKSPGDR